MTLVKNHLDCICRFFSQTFFRLGGMVTPPPPQMLLTVNLDESNPNMKG